MLLAIDVGNTNIVLGVFEGAALVRAGACRRCASGRPMSSACWSRRCSRTAARPRRSHPRRHPRLGRAAPDGHDEDDGGALFRAGPLYVEPGVNTGMPILYDTSRSRRRRIVNAVAAYESSAAPRRP